MSADKDTLKDEVRAAQAKGSAEALSEKKHLVEHYEEKQRTYDERCERVGNAGQLFLRRAREAVEGLPDSLTTELQLVYDEKADEAPYFLILAGEPEGVSGRLSVTLSDDGRWQVEQQSSPVRHAQTDQELEANIDEYLKPLLLSSAKARGKAAHGVDPAENPRA